MILPVRLGCFNNKLSRSLTTVFFTALMLCALIIPVSAGALKRTADSSSSLFAFFSQIPTGSFVLFLLILLAAAITLIVSVIYLRRHVHEKETLIAKEEQLQKEAKISAERTEFFGTVSHDMRTPLSGILGFADLALDCEDPAVIRNYLQKIRTSGKLLLELVNDTLVVAKTENKQFELHPTPTDCEELLNDIITPIRAAAEAKRVLFTFDAEKFCRGYALVDRLNFQKIFLNLLSNAVKFTPEGGKVDFTLQYPVITDQNPQVKAVVRDNGIGMSAEFLPKMFDLFSQEHSQEGGNPGGTGLGLTIVKRLVDAMGGTVQVQSAKGKGTAFTVFLPLEVLPDYRPPVKEDKAQLTNLSGKRILLCEDNEMNTEIARLVLQGQGMKVVCAENGEVGLWRFTSSAPGEFDAVLMDLRMPVMNGFEAAKAIRLLNRPDAKTVPIIALSADAYSEDAQKAMEAGMNAHLPKPLNAPQLFKTLASLL